MSQHAVNKPLGALPLLLIGIVIFIAGGYVLGAIGTALAVGGFVAIIASIVTAIGNASKKKH